MWRFLILTLSIGQALTVSRPSIVAKATGAQRRLDRVLYYDEAFLFAGRGFGGSRDPGGNTEPGLFVHSRQHERWIQVLQISTAGGKFGKSSSDDPEEQKKLRSASVSWDFTRYATLDYIDQPLRTSGSIAFPERIEYRPESTRYELRYFTSWGVPSAETVLYIDRRDLFEAFERSRAAAKSGLMSEAEAIAWAAAPRRDSDEGVFFGSCSYYAYVARRPFGSYGQVLLRRIIATRARGE